MHVSAYSISLCLSLFLLSYCFFFFFFNDTATTEIYTLSLHDALPIWPRPARAHLDVGARQSVREPAADRSRSGRTLAGTDRKSTRLNSSHLVISYAVFCLKKKKKKNQKRSITQNQ